MVKQESWIGEAIELCNRATYLSTKVRTPFFKSLYVGKTCSDGTAVRDASTNAYFDSLRIIPASIRSSSLISQNVS